MNPLLERFHAEKKAFNRLKKLCESKVVPKWHWEPDYHLESRQKGKEVPKERAWFGHGYDKENRVVVSHRYSIGSNPRMLHAMTFLRWSGKKVIGSEFIAEGISDERDIVIGSDFQVGGVLLDVFEATLSEARIVRVEHLGTGQYPVWDWKTITWQFDRVATVLEGMRGRKAPRQITYSKEGEVIEDLDLTEPVKRKPLPKGVTMKSLVKEIRERLAKAVVATVTKAKVKEPVYCLALNYDCEGNPLLLPELGIGLASERQAKLKRGGRDAKLEIWEPEEFSIFANIKTELKDKELERACDLYNRELEYEGSDEPGRKLILQVAADLAKMDWKGKLSTTEDFVVYAVDTDLADLRKNLKLTVPAKTLAKLKAAKML
jgi:hypothetical protein